MATQYEDNLDGPHDDCQAAVYSWGDKNWWVLARPCPPEDYIPDWDGDSATSTTVYGHTGMTKEQAEAFVAHRHEHTFCQHSYDCCGRIYHSAGRMVLHTPELIVVQQGWHRNV